MTSIKERFDTSFGKVLPQMGVEPSQISSLLSFFRQELLALAEEVELHKRGYGGAFTNVSKFQVDASNETTQKIASLIRSKADELN